MIIEIDPGKKTFWAMLIIAYLLINWLSMIVLGISRARKLQTYDFLDAVTGIILTILCLGWWYSS